MSFRGRTITGGTSGIGQAAAEQLQCRGAGDRDRAPDTRPRRRDRVRRRTGTLHRRDLTAPDGARNLAHAAGEIDVLINNAGIFPFGRSHEIPIDDVKAVLEFNDFTIHPHRRVGHDQARKRSDRQRLHHGSQASAYQELGLWRIQSARAPHQGLGCDRLRAQRGRARADTNPRDGRHGRGRNQATRRNSAAQTRGRSSRNRQHDRLPRLRRRQLHQRRHIASVDGGRADP